MARGINTSSITFFPEVICWLMLLGITRSGLASDIAELKNSLISSKFSHSQQNAPMDSRYRDYQAQFRK